MTTIKELKELDAKAIPAPYNVNDYQGFIEVPKGGYIIGRISSFIRNMDGDDKIHADLLCAARNALPDLIRVIEIAKDALDLSRRIIDRNAPDRLPDAYNIVKAADEINQALSEIRKLEGE